jgi:hypothetical protein
LIAIQLLVSNNLVNHVFNTICLLSDLLCRHTVNFGNSDDNPQFNCKVLIIVNDKCPYQETIPVRPGDYSKWTFVVIPQYTEIQEGINTITSKASCDSQYEPVLKLDPLTKEYVKYYGINVTGMPSGSELGSQEPFVFQAPGKNSREEGGDGTVGGGSEDGK